MAYQSLKCDINLAQERWMHCPSCGSISDSWYLLHILLTYDMVVVMMEGCHFVTSCACMYVETVSGGMSVYNVYSAGDGNILQHDVRQMNRPAVNLYGVISVTNSHARSQVLLSFVEKLLISVVWAQQQECWVSFLWISEFCVFFIDSVE